MDNLIRFNIMEEYKTIPGFTRYRMDTGTRKVYSKAVNPGWTELTLGRDGCYLLISDEGQRHRIRAIRLLYAVQNEVSPLDLPSGFLIVERHGKAVVIDRKGMMMESLKKRINRMAVRDVEKAYRDSMEFSVSVLEAYGTGDFSEVLKTVLKHEPEAIEYIRASGFARAEDTINEMWQQAVFVIMEGISRRKSVVLNVEACIRRVLRQLYFKRKKYNGLFRSYDDTAWYRSADGM